MKNRFKHGLALAVIALSSALMASSADASLIAY